MILVIWGSDIKHSHFINGEKMNRAIFWWLEVHILTSYFDSSTNMHIYMYYAYLYRIVNSTADVKFHFFNFKVLYRITDEKHD